MKYLWKLKQNKKTNVVEEGAETLPMDTEAVDEMKIAAEGIDTNHTESFCSNKPLSFGTWYVTFMCMSVPILGWIYLLIIAFTDKDPGRKQFARAWLLYKLTILLACITLIAVSVHMLIPYMEQLLNYMEAL